MAYQDQYAAYLAAVPKVIQQCYETGRRPVLVYTSNLDAIANCSPEQLNRLLDKYLKASPSYTNEEPIQSMEDFARIISYFAINGLGGEVDIVSDAVAEELRESFQMSYALGGTCAQGAGAIAAMGVPVLVHFTDESKEVIDCVNKPEVESVKDGKRVPLGDCISGKAPLIHFIMQYTKGGLLNIQGELREIPLSNRLIMQYDQVHKVMPVREDFLDYIESNTQQVCSYSISGFNAILDMEILKERVTRLKRHYETVKARNPKTVIYFESAHYISAKIRDYLYSELSPCMDIMGMNEEELADLSIRLSCPVNKDSIESIISGLDTVLNRHPARGVVLHSQDYSLYYGTPMEGIDLEMGLTLGNLMSGTKARLGYYGSQEDCQGNLSLPLSPVGLEFAARLEQMETRHHAILVPSRYIEAPRYTIGLGDTFVAGMQMCFAGRTD